MRTGQKGSRILEVTKIVCMGHITVMISRNGGPFLLMTLHLMYVNGIQKSRAGKTEKELKQIMKKQAI